MNPYLSPATYLGYIFKKLFQGVSYVLQPLERSLIEKYGEQGTYKYPLVFIIGAPRTGSTIFYQTITNYWDIGYLNNVECGLFRTILCASMMSEKMFKEKRHNNFQVRHGATKGLNSPSECGAFWYRWFPKARHFVDKDELPPAHQQDMRKMIGALMAIKKKPLFFKNMNCGQRIRALSQIFPEAIFIHCTRDPLYTAQSLLKVRKRIYGNFHTWWSIMPKEYPHLRSLSPYEQVVAQIYYIEKQIREDLVEFFPGRYTTINYECFANSPMKTLQEAHLFLEQFGCRIMVQDDIHFDFLTHGDRIILAPSIIKELNQHIQRYFD